MGSRAIHVAEPAAVPVRVPPKNRRLAHSTDRLPQPSTPVSTTEYPCEVLPSTPVRTDGSRTVRTVRPNHTAPRRYQCAATACTSTTSFLGGQQATVAATEFVRAQCDSVVRPRSSVGTAADGQRERPPARAVPAMAWLRIRCGSAGSDGHRVRGTPAASSGLRREYSRPLFPPAAS